MKTQPVIELFPKQEEFVRAALSGSYLFLLYGGAIRGGKTVVALAILFILCRIFPGSRWAIVRKDLPTLKRNTLPTFNKFRPEFVGNMNRADWVARCKNGSEIIFLPESIKDDPEGDRFRGLEVNGFVNEEANELVEQTFYREMERMGTWEVPGLEHQPPRLILNTCNPALGWVKERFYNPWRTGTLQAPYFYLPARADDNPYIPEDLKEGWLNLPERDYKRFVEGDWDVADDPDQLIRFEWVQQAYDMEPVGGRQTMGIDVARFGDDKTVFAYVLGNELYEVEEFAGIDTNQTAAYAQARISERGIGADYVGVDTVGLGAGVADNLRASGYMVQDIVSGASPLETDVESLYGFKNLRSQMWWHFREQLRLGQVAITCRHQKLVDDLLSVHYKMSADKVIQVESKDDIKKRIGRSTDYGDAVVYAEFVSRIASQNWLYA